MGDVQEELDKLTALARRVLSHEAVAKRDREEIRRRLPVLRAQGIGPEKLEDAILAVYVAGTISRWTSHAAPPGGPGRPTRRKAVA